MNKIEYKAAASAYRLAERNRAIAARGMGHRLASEIPAHEMARINAAYYAAGNDKPPPGFSRALKLPFGVILAKVRADHLAVRKAAERELVRRAFEAIECRLVGCDPPVYAKPSVAIAKERDAARAHHLSYIH